MKQSNFKEIYDEICANCGKQMEIKRKQALRKTILAFVILIILWVGILYIGANSKLIGISVFIFIISLVVFVLCLNKITKNYKLAFKKKVINEIVEKSNPNLSYDYYGIISPSEYSQSGFDNHWDRYNSEDLIKGTMEDGSYLKMGQVHTERRETTTDSDGHTQTTYVTIFFGLYGYIKLKTPTNADFMIVNNSSFSKFNKNRIEMESAEFEKYYDVFSGNRTGGLRQNAMEILTPEAIEQYTKIRNLFKKPLNTRVCKDTIYFRISVGDIFEPPTFKSSINFEMLYKYFLIIDVPRMIYETLIDNILVMYGDQNAREKRNFANMPDSEKEKYLKNK